MGTERIFTGPNVTVRRMGKLGTIVGFRGRGGPGFTGAWWVDLQGRDSASIAPGTINTVPATIGKAKLDDLPAPVLKFPTPMLDSEGRGWICAEVTCNPAQEWRIIGVEIVQVANPDSDDGRPHKGTNVIGGAKPLSGNRARVPLAMLRKRKGGQLDVFQIAFFDFQMRISFALDKTPQRFFFYS